MKVVSLLARTYVGERRILGQAPSADRSVVSAGRGIEACRPPLPGTRGPSRRSPAAAGSPPFWRPGTVVGPNVIGAWGVTTRSANRAGDESWVAGIELAMLRRC